MMAWHGFRIIGGWTRLHDVDYDDDGDGYDDAEDGDDDDGYDDGEDDDDDGMTWFPDNMGGGPGHMYSPHPNLITGGRSLDWYPVRIPDDIVATVAQD